MKCMVTLGMLLLIVSCTSTEKTTSKSFHAAIRGQNETKIQSILGPPTQILRSSGGGKIMMYEIKTKGMFLTPYKSQITYSPKKDVIGNRKGITFSSGVSKATNDPEYTIYQENISYLKVFLDKNGTCIRCEEELPGKIKDFYHDRFRQIETEKD